MFTYNICRGPARGRRRDGGHDDGGHRGLIRLKRDLNNKLVQRDLGSGQHRYPEDVKRKYHVHMSYERVARNAQTLKNVHERAFAETEDAGK